MNMGSVSAFLAQPIAALLVPVRVFWPYLAGAVVLITGLLGNGKDRAQPARGLDRATAFGPLFFAIPMAVFGADHFTAPQIVASIVPSWIPGHLFWVYFVGTALITAALSIVTKKLSVLAASLLSGMILSFVLLIHVPAFAANPGDRIKFAVLLRDLSFSGGAFAYALTQAKVSAKGTLNWARTLVRCVIGVPSVVFGIEHFLHPEFVPVVPLSQLMPLWIPGHFFLAYVTGVVLMACGLSIVFDWRAHLAATGLGIYIFLVVLLVYLPIMAANVSNIGNGLNYFVDTLAFGGTALLLAGLLPSEAPSDIPLKTREELAGRAGVFQNAGTARAERP